MGLLAKLNKARTIPIIVIRRFDEDNIRRFSLCSNLRNGTKEVSKKYSRTLFLPKTSFPVKLQGKKRVERDQTIFEKCNFSEMYNWQRENRHGEEFILHDGPPYANGSPHLGHAVNKILKDITIRFECSQGKKVHYMPGWDCHGLPIELAAIKGNKKLDPVKIREIAAKFAKKAIAIQMSQFKSWGILADWSNCYRTLDPDYVKVKLEKFYELYSKGFVFRDYMPVFWSPSSQTALAEAELEYNHHHVSPSIYLRFKLCKMSAAVEAILGSSPVYLVVWTTTPWSVVANQAVCYSDHQEYIGLRGEDGGVYLVAAASKDQEVVRKAVGGGEVVATIKGGQLNGCWYTHPLYPERSRPCLAGDHVTISSGTGLVHTAPAHGQDDFRVGIKNGLPLQCMVDQNGCYQEEVGHGLEGCDVLDGAGEKVLQILGEEVIHKEDYVHSYPYDWRTKKPVILRGSKQWFIDTDKLKKKALDVLKDVEVHPESGIQGLRSTVERRPYWCISRQRVWGSPIPVLYDIHTGETVISKQLIHRYCQLIDKHGTGFWWQLPLEEILSGTGVNSSQVSRGDDILDIWFDSGISWSCVLGRPAHLYLEGLDQFSGWFYSSLLTSVALQQTAPYSKIFVHGFTLDEEGNKMSKSLGNVIDPKDVVEGAGKTPALGVDVLRWWVAAHASSSSSVLVGPNILELSSQEVNKIRNIAKYLVGLLDGFNKDQLVEYSELEPLDKLVLHKMNIHQEQLLKHFGNMEYSKVCLATLGFVTSLSKDYLHLVKDRMYCDGKTWSSRLSGVTTVYWLVCGLSSSLAPVLPLLTEEMAMCCPLLESPLKAGWIHQSRWSNQELVEDLDVVEDVREVVNKMEGKLNEMCAVICAGGKDRDTLLRLTPAQLAEMVGVAAATVVDGGEAADGVAVRLEKSKHANCVRCRRHTAAQGELCCRCRDVIKELDDVDDVK